MTPVVPASAGTGLAFLNEQPDEHAVNALYQAFWQAISQAETVLLACHTDPDGDTLGAVLALSQVFETGFPRLSRIDRVYSGHLSKSYGFLPGYATLQLADALTLGNEEDGFHYDVSICIDCGAASRMGENQAAYTQAKTRVNIDHHISNSLFGSLNLVDTQAAASCQIIAALLKAANFPLTADIATCLYAGLLMDTECFTESTTTPAVFELAAELLRAGADPQAIYRQTLASHPMAKVSLHAEAMQLLQMNQTRNLVWTIVTQAMLAQHQAIAEYVEGLVEQMRDIEGVDLALILREKFDGSTKISLRSNSAGLNAAKLLEPFGGGGHHYAAGLEMDIPPDQALATILPALNRASNF